MTRAAWHWFAGLVFWLAAYGWFALVAYARWLRFSSPWSAKPETGQVVFLKTGNAMFYVTPAQAFWADTFVWFVWAIGLGAFAVFVATFRRGPAPRDRSGYTRAELVLGLAYAAALLLFLPFIQLAMRGGDEILQFIATGSSALPPEPGWHHYFPKRDG